MLKLLGLYDQYKEKYDYFDEYSSTKCNDEKTKLVIENQLIPIAEKAKNQEGEMAQIVRNYNELDGDLNKHYEISTKMSKDRKYNYDKEYDLNDPIKNKDEVRKEDVRKMAELSSQTLFLGGLATFTLILGVIMIKNSD